MLFSKNHIWLKVEGDMAKIGVSDYAQEQLGGILFINLPEAGEQLEIGKRFGDIESIKTVSDLLSPIDGIVLRINVDLLDMPEAINLEPYESWIIEARIEQLSRELMDKEAYDKYRTAL